MNVFSQVKNIVLNVSHSIGDTENLNVLKYLKKLFLKCAGS